jgi:Ca2+-binding EF-hand superfamily protein
MGPALMRALDTNGDGKISSSEISDAAAALKKLDKNGDGEIGRDELMPPLPAGGFRGRGDSPERPQRGEGQGPNMEVLMNRLKQFDKDGDGKFKKDELPERLQERFEDIDTNGNGEIDEAELRQMASGPGRFRRPEGQRPEGGDRGERRRPDRSEGRAAEEKEGNRD